MEVRKGSLIRLEWTSPKMILFAANNVSSVYTPNIVRCTKLNFPELEVFQRKLDFAFKTQQEVNFDRRNETGVSCLPQINL